MVAYTNGQSSDTLLNIANINRIEAGTDELRTFIFHVRRVEDFTVCMPRTFQVQRTSLPPERDGNTTKTNGSVKMRLPAYHVHINCTA
jgi:hypothetical protein